jgi:hypothetical protein
MDGRIEERPETRNSGAYVPCSLAWYRPNEAAADQAEMDVNNTDDWTGEVCRAGVNVRDET